METLTVAGVREVSGDGGGTMGLAGGGLPASGAMDLVGSMGKVTATWSVTGCLEPLRRSKEISKREILNSSKEGIPRT